MEQKPQRKTLHIKLGLILLIGISIPTVTFFITQNLLISASAGLISFFLSIFALILILKPLGTFLKATQSLGDGNLNFRLDIRSKDEFEDVASSINLMAQKLAANYQKFEADKNLYLTQNNKLETVLSSIIDGVVAVDTSKNIVFVNRAAEYLTGYTNVEMQGKPVEDFIHLFLDAQQISSKTYCQGDYNQRLLLVDKNGKQQRINLTTTLTSQGIHSNLSCILILHDLSKEQELEQMKLDFVSMASHELKTPLTSIIGYLSVFINENKNKIEKEPLELLNRSLVSAQILFNLIENLLSVNKIEREQLSVTVEPSDYFTILKRGVEDSQNQAKLKDISLTLQTPQMSLPKVLLDPIRIFEVINNLISNAIKYTDPGGKIEVSLEVNPTEVITTVSDNGFGISQEAIPRLFSKFFRVSNTAQKAEKGTGLGLFIAKSIIEKLNGKIWVESEAGKGSKFHFSLPTIPQSQATVNQDKVVSETIQSGALNY